MTSLEYCTVGDVVVADYRTAAIFRKYQIDFACSGNKLLKEVCTKSLIRELEAFIGVSSSKADPFNEYQQLPLDLLVAHIRKKHHDFVRSQIQIIKRYLDDLCVLYRKQYAELTEIRKLFYSVADMLIICMDMEERELFPLFSDMQKIFEAKIAMDSVLSCSLEDNLDDIKSNHKFCISCFQAIRNLSGGYTIPGETCTLFRLTYVLLGVFETDLFLHIHIENNILFPRSIELKELLN